jgi:hypothetical protein
LVLNAVRLTFEISFVFRRDTFQSVANIPRNDLPFQRVEPVVRVTENVDVAFCALIEEGTCSRFTPVEASTYRVHLFEFYYFASW